MKMSKRLQHIADMIPKCHCVADIGTDHGYIPIYALLNNVSEKAVASDINQGPVEAANKNIARYGLTNKIDTRVGPGLSTIKSGEADVIVIAGMGGNLIADILADDMIKAKSAEYLILQPVQYPEVLRKYLCSSGFLIIDEDLAEEDGRFYQILKVSKGTAEGYVRESDFFLGEILVKKGHPLLKKYIESKICKFNIILDQLNNSKDNPRYIEIYNLKKEFEDVMKCL